LINAEQRQATADLWTKQSTSFIHMPTHRQLVNHTHHRHLLLLSPKADTHFTYPWRVEGWVDLGGWLYRNSPADGHPSQY